MREQVAAELIGGAEPVREGRRRQLVSPSSGGPYGVSTGASTVTSTMIRMTIAGTSQERPRRLDLARANRPVG